jgi:hypothetical protein
MPAGKRKGCVVTEIFSEPIHSIVAIETGVAIFDGMSLGEDRVNIAMTIQTGVRSERGNIALVTIIARERLTRRCQIMALQGITNRFMRKPATVHDGKGCVCPAMFWMAMAARQVGVIVVQFSMERGDILHLAGNHTMTVRTSVGHCRTLPWRGVTGFTIPASLCMGGHPAQHLSALRIQGSRVIEQSAFCIHIPRNGDRSEKRGKNSRPGKTT